MIENKLICESEGQLSFVITELEVLRLLDSLNLKPVIIESGTTNVFGCPSIDWFRIASKSSCPPRVFALCPSNSL